MSLDSEKRSSFIVFSMLLGAFVLRVILAPLCRGFPCDTATFMCWADEVFARGFSNIYRPDYFCDYPPLFLYLLFPIGLLKSALHIPFGSPVHQLLIKLPSIIADIATSYILFRMAAAKLDNRAAILIAAAYAFNPATILNSAVWGQVDSIMALLLIPSLYLLAGKRYVEAMALYGMALLFKPQALFLLPLILLALAATGDAKKIVSALLSSLLTFIILAIPFSLKQGPWCVLQKLANAVKSYPYASLNACNLYALMGDNWAPIAKKFLFLPLTAWGILLTSLLYLYILYLCLKSKEKDQLFIPATLVFFTVFMVMISMHERYLYPTMALLLAGYISIEDKRLLTLYGTASIAQFFNVFMVYQAALSGDLHIPASNPALRLLACAHLLIFAYALIVGTDLLRPSGASSAGGATSPGRRSGRRKKT